MLMIVLAIGMACLGQLDLINDRIMLNSAVFVDAGCAPSSGRGLSGIYLLSLSYSNRTSPKVELAQLNTNLTSIFHSTASMAQLEVRASYRGICIRSQQGKWTCAKNATKLANSVRALENGDPLNLIWIAANFSDHIVFDGLMKVLP